MFGAFSPIDGHHFLLELPFCNTDTFQIFLDQLSEYKPTELKVMVLDNAAFHKAQRLQIPHNIILIFQPPYSPELNAAEKIWARLKRTFSNKLHKTLEDLSAFITTECRSLTTKEVVSITSFEYVLECPIWTI